MVIERYKEDRYVSYYNLSSVTIFVCAPTTLTFTDLRHYPWVTGSDELGLHQRPIMPIEGKPDPQDKLAGLHIIVTCRWTWTYIASVMSLLECNSISTSEDFL